MHGEVLEGFVAEQQPVEFFLVGPTHEGPVLDGPVAQADRVPAGQGFPIHQRFPVLLFLGRRVTGVRDNKKSK